MAAFCPYFHSDLEESIGAVGGLCSLPQYTLFCVSPRFPNSLMWWVQTSQSATIAIFTGNTPGWNKPEFSLNMSLHGSAEELVESYLSRTRHRQPLTWPYTVYEIGLWTFLQESRQIAITLTADKTKDPRGLSFTRSVCVIFKYIFFRHTETEQFTLSVRSFAIAKIFVICLYSSYNGPLEALQLQLSFVPRRGIISLPHSWDFAESQQWSKP